jgi:hypothetical protein
MKFVSNLPHVGGFLWILVSDYRHFQQYFSYIMTVSFIGGGNEYPEKTTDMWQVTDKLHHIKCCMLLNLCVYSAIVCLFVPLSWSLL